MMGSAAESTRAREAYFLYARTVRTLVGDIPLTVTGGFRTGSAMESAVRAGECDVVGIGRPTVTTPDAVDVLLSGRSPAIRSHQIRYGMRNLLRRLADVEQLDGILDLSWHTDQLHRLGAGLEPGPDRGRLATTVAMVRRNGCGAFRGKRSG